MVDLHNVKFCIFWITKEILLTVLKNTLTIDNADHINVKTSTYA